LNANILKAPNATSIDQAFNVLCNLDALAPPPTQPQVNIGPIGNGNGIAHANGNGSLNKQDLFAQMRPPPKKSINELRGSPPTSSSPSGINAIPLSTLDELYSSSPTSLKMQSISPSFGGGATLGFTSSSAPPIPPRPSSSSNGLLPPPPTPTENPSRHNRRPLPQPINGTNGVNVGNGVFFENHKAHDPFADDPFFAS